MKLKFVPNNGFSKKRTAIVARELTRIEKEKGCIKPEIVVQEAQSKTSALHNFFEWDDSAAAAQHRLWQARKLIQSVSVVIVGETDATPIRAFVNLRPDEEEEGSLLEQSYVGMRAVQNNPGFQKQVLHYAYTQLVQWKARFGHIKDFLAVSQAIEKTKVK